MQAPAARTARRDAPAAVTWQDKSGYAIQTAIDFSGRVPPRRVSRPRYYVEVPPIYYAVPPPVYYGPYFRA